MYTFTWMGMVELMKEIQVICEEGNSLRSSLFGDIMYCTRYEQEDAMKKHMRSLLLSLSSLGLPALVIWMAAYERNLHLMKWNPGYRTLFIGLCLLALIIVLVINFDLMIRRRRDSQRPAGIYTYILAVLGILVAVAFFLYLSPYKRVGDKAPQLIITDQSGSSGLPDVSLVWYTIDERQDSLSYGRDPDQLSVTIAEEQAGHQHALVMSDLIPGETYYYSRGSEQEVTSFTYMPGSGRTFRFAVASDAHIGADNNDPEATEMILKTISSPEQGYSIFFNLGDAVEMGNDDSQYAQQIRFFSPYTSKLPLVQIPGNHDMWFAGNHFWEDYYYPEGLPSASSPSQLYHRYDFPGDIHVFTLDLEWGTETYTKEQRSWFEKELASIDGDDLIIILNHAFHFASSTDYDGMPWYDNQEMIDTFHQLFIDSGVDLVFSGHDHQMEHIEQDGIQYVIVGSLGGHKDKIPTYVAEGSRYRNFIDSGYADLMIEEDTVSLELRRPDGSSLYRFSMPR